MEPLLTTEALAVRYRSAQPLASRGPCVTALDGVSISIAAGTTLALVGRSGSGKSTLALCLACLERPTAGRIVFEGRDLTRLSEAELRAVRPRIQLVFQDPAASLNPRFTAEELIGEPLRVQNRLTPRERAERVRMLLERVGLSPAMAGRTAMEFSGGQRQRLAIARAMAIEPRVLVLDEALSALDCSVQAQIANLLTELQPAFGLTYVFITHDFQMAVYLADEIAVMEGGRIIERGRPDEMFRCPNHPVTQSLVAAAARMDGASDDQART